MSAVRTVFLLLKKHTKYFHHGRVHCLVKQHKKVDLLAFLHNSWNVTSYCMQLILGYVSIFKSVNLPAVGSLTVITWV
jgi:hypothetical protein